MRTFKYSIFVFVSLFFIVFLSHNALSQKLKKGLKLKPCVVSGELIGFGSQSVLAGVIEIQPIDPKTNGQNVTVGLKVNGSNGFNWCTLIPTIVHFKVPGDSIKINASCPTKGLGKLGIAKASFFNWATQSGGQCAGKVTLRTVIIRPEVLNP